MFIGWLLGSATLHAVALAAIPYVKLPDGAAAGDIVQVHLSPGYANERAIEKLSEAPGLQTPETLFPSPDPEPDTVSVTGIQVLPTLNDDAAFSSLVEAFEIDEQVIASLDVLSTLVVDEPAPLSPRESSRVLVPPTAKPFYQRSDLELSVSLDNTVEVPSAEIPGESIELPVPIARPAGPPVEVAQPATLTSAIESAADAKAAEISDHTSATGESVATATATDLSVLISLLHEEIARHKQYPSLAKRQQREGTATVSFALYPDGAIDQVNVVSSSGFGRLDKAALYAVSEAAPFAAAEHYLDRARHFKVNIVFSLQ